jgi:hypothetical protein
VVTIRGQQYTSGNREFKAMNVSATYKIERTPVGVKLLRQGELVILPPRHRPGQTLTSAQVTLRTLLRKRFDTLLEPEIVSQGLELPGKWKKLGKLSLAHLDCNQGWLVLAWNRK